MAPSLKLNNSYFIAGIGTDVGKSFLVENLCRIFVGKNISVNAIKPIASGFSETHLLLNPQHSPPCHPGAGRDPSAPVSTKEHSSWHDGLDPGLRRDDKVENICQSDTTRILRALGQEITPDNINKTTPWRFPEPLSPHLAAKINNREINFSEVVNFCKTNITTAKNLGQTLFIESAGGLMTPINDQKTFLDLAFELEIPVLLLSANYLGSISHTLCAAKILRDAQIFVEKIIVNDDLFQPHATKTSDVIKTIEAFSKTTTISLNDFLNLVNEQH